MVFLTITFEILLFGITLAPSGGSNEPLEAWERFRSLAAPRPSEQTPELEQELRAFLASLTFEDLLTAARQGCIAVSNKPSLTSDWERKAAAESNALLCVESYFEVQFRGDSRREDCQQVAGKLVEVAADSEELNCLRGAILARLSYSENTRFQVALVDYPAAHATEVDRVLGAIIDDHLQGPDVRKEAISAQKRGILRQIRNAYKSDPNLQEALRQAREQTDAVVNPGDLLRSGKASLGDETVKALEPTVDRMRRNIVSLGGILADANQPSDVRQEAKRALESYQQSAITELDAEIDTALEKAKE